MPLRAHHRLAAPLAAASVAAASGTAAAATVRKVSAEKDQILVELTQAEMAVMTEGRAVILEIGKDRFIASGRLTKINIVKQTAVIELDEADDRIEAKQKVGFASFFWNVASSPVMTAVAQYHQYSRSFVEGRVGGFGGQLSSTDTTQSHSDESKATFSGYLMAVEGHLVIYPHNFGFGAAYERRDGSGKTEGTHKSDEGETTSKSTTSETVNILTPSVWFETTPGLRYGLGYAYKTVDYGYELGDFKPKWNFTTGRILASLVGYGDTSEWGVEYHDRGRQEQSDTLVGDDASQTTVRYVYTDPAELAAFYRSASSRTFIWGLRGSYLLVDRRGAKDAPLDRRPTIPEQLTLRLSFEHRLTDGDKLEWMITYAGAQAHGLDDSPRGINAAGFALTYQMPLGTGWTGGGTFAAEGGALKVQDDREAESGGEVVTTEASGVNGSLVVFVRREFEGEGRRRR
jgi:hypothetical protein